MRKFKALLLCVILAVSLIGSGPAERVVGQALTKNSGWTQDSEEPEPVEEMTELRTASSKTYKLTNGSYRYVAYAGPIHYLDSDGKYREIDTSLVASRDSDFL